MSDLSDFLAEVTSGILAMAWCGGLLQGYLRPLQGYTAGHCSGSGSVSDAKCIIQLTKHI